MHLVIIGSTEKKIRRGGVPSYLNEVFIFFKSQQVNFSILQIGGDHIVSENEVQNYASLNSNFFVRCFLLRKKIKELKKKHGKLMFSVHYWRELIFSLDIVLFSPYVVHFHGPAYLEAKMEGSNRIFVFLTKAYELICYKRAIAFVCLSQAYREILVEKYKVKESLVNVIPYGFLPEKIHIKERVFEKQLNIICVRRLVKRVGVLMLIEACAKLKANGCLFKLNVVGEGYMKKDLENYVILHKLENEINFTGLVDDIQLESMLANSHISVMPSIGLEGFGISTIEALFRGTPVIGTKVGGTTEILSGLDNNLIIDEITANSIYNKLKDIYDKKISLPPSDVCHRFTVEHYSMKVIGPKLQNLYIRCGLDLD